MCVCVCVRVCVCVSGVLVCRVGQNRIYIYTPYMTYDRMFGDYPA